MSMCLYMFCTEVTSLNVSGSKLSEACHQQQFNRNVEDVERWLNDIESSLISEDYGKVDICILTLTFALSPELVHY